MKKLPSRSNSSRTLFSRLYGTLLLEIKERIRTAQVHAAVAANKTLINLYWEIGRLLSERQKSEGWGAGVLPRLAKDLENDLPEVKGFSLRNLKRMLQFFNEYPALFAIGPQAVAQLKGSKEKSAISSPIALLPWGHNIVLIEKLKELPTRAWYARQALENGWSRNVLLLQIENGAHLRKGKAVNNFSVTLPPTQSDLAGQLLKDPYMFDFLTLEEPFHERELECGLLKHLQKFLMELGSGFAFVGRQVPLQIGEDDFYLDLLFYHLRLRCFVVIELKIGPFKAEYAGKMNFYLNAIDDRMRHKDDQPTIGIILCEEKNRIVAEYALRGLDKAIGISDYQLTRALPRRLQSALPSIEELETELSQSVKTPRGKLKKGKRNKRLPSAA